jgi:putative ubiquitin-RnfH superfamily antitoxin RatB of RatAB toxin-antitoxin module
MAASIRVEVLRAWPRRHEVRVLELPEGATVADAVAAAGFTEEADARAMMAMPTAVFGEIVATDHPLRDGDRVELLRPLLIDPKEARRRRARKPARE